MPEQPTRRRPCGAGRAARPAPSRPIPRDRDSTGPAIRPAPSRLDAEEENDKVAPWKAWTPVKLRASRGGKYNVQFTVTGLDDEINTRYSRLITSAAHKYFKIEKPPREGEGPAAYLVETLSADEESAAVELLRVVYRELIVQ